MRKLYKIILRIKDQLGKGSKKKKDILVVPLPEQVF